MDSIHELLRREAQAVLDIPVTDAYDKAVCLIVEQVHQKKGNWLPAAWEKPDR